MRSTNPDAEIYFEHTFIFNDYKFNVIFGEDTTGGFIEIATDEFSLENPLFANSICTDATFLTRHPIFADVNRDRLIEAGVFEELAIMISEYIDDWLHTGDRFLRTQLLLPANSTEPLPADLECCCEETGGKKL